MRFLVTVAWRNLWRHGRRSLITAGAMAFGVALCMAMIAYADGMFAKMFDVMVTQNLGHVQVHAPGYPSKRLLHQTISDVDPLLAQIDQIPEIAGVSPRVFGYGLAGGAETSTGARLAGVRPSREASVAPVEDWIQAGRWLADEPAREAVLGKGLAETLELDVGGEIVVITQSADGSMGNDLYQVVGLAQTGSAMMDRGGLWLHMADLQELLVLPEQAHEIGIVGHDPDDSDAIAAKVRQIAGERDLLVRTWAEADPQAAQLLGMQNVSAFILLGIVFSVAALGILNTMLMAVFERTRELGVLRALGLTPRQLVGMVIWESVLLGVLAGLGGGLIGGLLDLYLVLYGVDLGGDEPLTYEGVRFDTAIYGVVRWEPIAYTMIALLLVCVIASLWPAFRAARLRPVDAMRQV